jgi:NAD-dependent dihydropyrimidine dehydrogenase PreA subunit
MSGIRGLDEIFRSLYKRGCAPDPSLQEELLRRVRAHNYVPGSSEGEYAAAFSREYERFCRQKEGGEGVTSPAHTTWHGIPRYQVPWFPTIAEDLCDGCGRCVEFCSHSVFEPATDAGTVVVAEPLNCLVGCDSCALICPRRAVFFPPRAMLGDLRRA